jgi:hypothetical protein
MPLSGKADTGRCRRCAGRSASRFAGGLLLSRPCPVQQSARLLWHAELGHEDPCRLPILSGRFRLGEATFARADGKRKDAQIATIRGTVMEPPELTWSQSLTPSEDAQVG